jgi:hypothetical protein
MIRKFPTCLTIALVVITGLAQNPAKPYTEWSDKEVKKVLENSPWAPLTDRNGHLGNVL